MVQVPLPDAASRSEQLTKQLDTDPVQRRHPLSSADMARVVSMTEGCSSRFLLERLCSHAKLVASR